MSGQRKLKIRPYLSAFERSLQKKVSSVLTNITNGRPAQTLTFLSLWHWIHFSNQFIHNSPLRAFYYKTFERLIILRMSCYSLLQAHTHS